MKGFHTKMQAVCTCWCIIALLLAAIGTVLIHMAFKVLLEPLEQLPSNLETGINDVLGFADLEPKVRSVKTHAEAALGKCNVVLTTCPNPPAMPGQSSDTTVELNGISLAFNTTLRTISHVVNDPYMGIEEFEDVVTDLETMQQKLTELQNQPQPIQCAATNQAFCSMRDAADAMLSEISTVQDGVNRIINNPAIEQYEDISERFSSALNLLPYIFWICVLFYTCFLMSKTPSCKGGRMACCSCTCHSIFFVISLLISIIFVAVGISITILAKDITLPAPFKGQPTVDQLIEHVKNTFPEFYALVFEELINGLKKTFAAYLVFFVAHIMLLINACTCCCGLYIDQEKASELSYLQ